MSVKFRGLDRKNQWRVLPNFVTVAGMSYLCSDDGFITKASDEGLTAVRGDMILVSNVSVGVGTGKKDSGENEIFEGDILRKSDKDYLVTLEDGGFTAAGIAESTQDAALTDEFAAASVIVGKFAQDPVFISPEDGTSVFWGHTVSDLQEDIAVADGAITGKLKYVDSGTLAHDWGAGYFIALKFLPAGDTDSIRVGLDPSVSSRLVELDEDMNGVFKITDKSRQRFVVETEVGRDVIRQSFDLSGLTLVS